MKRTVGEERRTKNEEMKRTIGDQGRGEKRI